MKTVSRLIASAIVSATFLTGLGEAVAAGHSEAAQQDYVHAFIWQKNPKYFDDDGVKGVIRNNTPHAIDVTDCAVSTGKTYRLAPNHAMHFYQEHMLRSTSQIEGGSGAWLQFRRAGDHKNGSHLMIADPQIGRPDTVYRQSCAGVTNVRKGWKENESHYENAGNHRFWVKREPDSWKTHWDTHNTGDWAAYTININSI